MSIGAGLRYLLAREFMAYHAVVAGRTWAQLETGVQTIILGMLTIVGGGFLACGIATAWLTYRLHRGERWAGWAMLCVTAALWLPTLYVTIRLRAAAPGAETPIVPTIVILVLTIAGVASSAKRRFPGSA